MNGCLVNPAVSEMYKKEIAALTEELARERESSKAARQDLETELAKLRYSLERRELELKKDLDKERDLRKQVEKNADERSKAARQDLEKELANLRNSLARRELEQAELKKDLDEERVLGKQVEKNADESKAARQELEMELANLRNSFASREISILRADGPGLGLDEPMAIVQRRLIQNGKYVIKNRAADFFWSAWNDPISTVYFYSTTIEKAKTFKSFQVNNHFPIIQVVRG